MISRYIARRASVEFDDFSTWRLLPLSLRESRHESFLASLRRARRGSPVRALHVPRAFHCVSPAEEFLLARAIIQDLSADGGKMETGYSL